MQWARRTKSGFTIVELLIVIVVIGILAAITVVAYNGVQNKAKFTNDHSSLQSINKSLAMYKALNSHYPIVSSWQRSCTNAINGVDFIPGLSEVSSNIPAAPCNGEDSLSDTWAYSSSSDGQDYKLIYLRANVSGGYRDMVPSEMRDMTSRWSSGVSWGYWTEGGTSF